MAKGILYDPESFSEDQLILIKKGDGVVTTEGSGTNTVAQGNSTVPIYIGGKYAGYTVKNLDPVRGVEVVVDDAGNTKWLPYNVNERLVPYLNADGQLDLLGAVQGGVTDIIDYAGWQVTPKELEDTVTISKYISDGGFNAQKAYDDGVELETIRTFASEFVPRQDLPTDNVPTNTDVKNEALKPYMTSAGGLDIFASVANGITNVDEYKEFDVTQQDIDNIQSLLKYRLDDGRINVSQALKDGVDRAILEEYFDISDTVTEAPKETSGNKIATETVKVEDFMEGSKLNVDKALKAGVSDASLMKAGVSKSTLKRFKSNLIKENVLKPFITNGRADIGKAVAKLGVKQLQDVGVDAKTVRLADIANRYNKADGTFDTLAAIRGNVSDADLRSLGLSAKNIQDAKDIIVMENAGLDPNNYTLTEAIQKGIPDDVLYRWNDKSNVDAAKQYINLDKFYVDGKTSIETAKSLGASEEQLRELGFSDNEIKQFTTYQELSNGGYILNDNELNIRKMYNDGKLDLLLTANPEITQTEVNNIKNEYANLDKNYVALGTGNYIAKADFNNLSKELDRLDVGKNKAKILDNLLNTGDFDAYTNTIQGIFNDKVDSIYVTNGDQILDYNYNGIKQLQRTGKLDSTLNALGVEDIASWKQSYEDANYLNDFVNAKNSLQNRPNGTIDDYIYEAPQNVLDRVNRLYGTDYQHGKYVDLYNRMSDQNMISNAQINRVGDATGKTLDDLIKSDPRLASNPAKAKAEYLSFLTDRLQEITVNGTRDWSKEQDILKISDLVWSNINGEKILKTFGVPDDVAKKIQPMTWIANAKDALINFQNDSTDMINENISSEVVRAIPKLGLEVGINDLIVDNAIIGLSLVESSGKVMQGKASEGLTDTASLLVQVATYPLTIPKKWVDDPSQAFAETMSFIIPSPDIKAPLKKVASAASYATFGKIADITKIITAPIAGASTAKTTNVSFVYTDQKTAKTSTLPIATGTMKEATPDLKGFRPSDFGQVVGSGIVSDKAGRDVNYTRYQDENGNITIQLYTGDKTKWDLPANELVWDTIQQVSHDTNLATGKTPAVTVVYGNYKVTSSPDGAKMSFAKGNKVHTVQASKNISPYDYSNNYKVSNMGVKVDKTGKDAPTIVLNTIKAKDYSSDSSGKITLENRKTKRVEKTVTDNAKLNKLIAKDVAKSAAKVIGIVLEPRFTKRLLSDVKKVIDNKAPRTFEDNYKALQQLSFALQAMEPKDVAKVMEWAKRPEMKRLLDRGEYSKFVEIIGLDRVVVPKVWTKEWEAIYKDSTNPKSKEMSQEFLSKIRNDISKFQAIQTKKYQKGKKTKQAVTKAIIPVLLATRLAMPASYGFDAGKLESAPKIVMVDGRAEFRSDTGKTNDKLDDRIDDVKPEEKTDVKQDVTPKFDDTKFNDFTSKPSFKTQVGKTEIQDVRSKTELSGNEIKGAGGNTPRITIEEKIGVETVGTNKAENRDILRQEKAEVETKADVEQTKVNDKLDKTETKESVKADTKDVTKADFQDIVKENVDQDIKANVKDRIQNRMVDVQKYVDVSKIDNTTKFNDKINIKKPRLNIKPPKLRIGSEKKKSSKTKEEKLGKVTIAWRQGSLKVNGRTKPVWIVIRKKGNQLVKSYEYKTPEGAPVSKGKAYQTLFYRGKKVRPFKLKVGFSNVTVDLSKTGKDRIKFERSDAYKYKLPTQRQLSRSKF